MASGQDARSTRFHWRWLTGSEDVDAFVRTKVLPEYQLIVAKLRELMREMAPDAQEVIAYGIPMYKGRKYLAVINPSKSGITFSFVYGRQFEDRFGLLRGVGRCQGT